MTEPIFDSALWEQELRHGHFRHRDARNGRTVEVESLSLGSEFRPLYSRAHGRPVGHRGVLDVWSMGEQLGHDRARAEFQARGCSDRVAALEAGLHMSNYRLRDTDRGWLVLRMADELVRHPRLWPPLPQDLFSTELYAPHELVLEVSADAATFQQLRDFVAYHQELGFAVALSEFGARQADLGAVWGIRPDMVSIAAASLAAQSSSIAFPRRLGALCRVLHESGCMVAVRDVDDDALLDQVLETDVDLIEGRSADACGEPGRGRRPTDPRMPALRQQVAECADDIGSGMVFESACESLLGEAGVLRCYILDGEGIQLTENLSPVGTRSDPRFWPLANAVGACWAHREYFRSAMAHPGQVMATAPYFSLPDGRHCVTLSIALHASDGQLILCCDMIEADAGAA
ncbi:MAG TPA: EAL domain-containing protein [Pseudomonadales bacterium]|nr:EAL domain-containing protein [Pseudomonadales bacterium]